MIWIKSKSVNDSLTPWVYSVIYQDKQQWFFQHFSPACLPDIKVFVISSSIFLPLLISKNWAWLHTFLILRCWTYCYKQHLQRVCQASHDILLTWSKSFFSTDVTATLYLNCPRGPTSHTIDNNDHLYGKEDLVKRLQGM